MARITIVRTWQIAHSQSSAAEQPFANEFTLCVFDLAFVNVQLIKFL
jgi:hypothetical protein